MKKQEQLAVIPGCDISSHLGVQRIHVDHVVKSKIVAGSTGI